MKTYYFGVCATIGKYVSQSFYAVDAPCYDSAERAVCLASDWIWIDPRNTIQVFSLTKFLYEKLKAKTQVDGVVISRKAVSA